MPTPRYYSFNVVSYASLDELLPLIHQSRHWCYILHDKDDGKDPHFHLLMTFQTARSVQNVYKAVMSEQNTFAEPLKDFAGSLTYLTHGNDPDKHQYDESEVVYDDEDYWNHYCVPNKEPTREEFVDDLISDNYTPIAMAYKYGRDYIRNIKSYEYFRHLVRGEIEEREENQ